MAQLRVGDVGSVLRITVRQQDGSVFNASAMSVRTLKLQPPSGTVFEVTASFETTGSDGVFRYTWADGDLAEGEAGHWSGQLYLEGPGVKLHTDPFTFPVGENLS